MFKFPLVALVTLLLLSQCRREKPDFYRDAMHGHDVWRLPIIDPHELITADCFSACRGWNYQMGSSGLTDFNPDSINFQRHYIYFHGEFDQGFGFLNIETNKLTRSLNRRQFTDSLRKLGLTPKLFHTTSLYHCWRKTGQLPWAQEILAAQECHLLSKQP